MCRFLVLVIATLGWVVSAQAETLYFVSVATLAHDKREQYEEFLQKVAPLWRKHNMKILIRARIVEAVAVGDISDAPHEIGILEVASRKDFQAYLADADYQLIKQQRSDAMENFVVLEGVASQLGALKYLSKTPMAAIVLSTKHIKPSKVSLSLSIQLAGQVKGPVSNFLKKMNSIQVHALSFDDNPMGYMPTNEQSGGALGLVGALLR
ncbi:MAG: DUF1330 domain-containing protein [Rhizobiaceae bacterium]